MLHQHLPILISRLVTLGRHASDYYYHAARVIEIGFCRLQASPRFGRLRQLKRAAGRKLLAKSGQAVSRRVPLLIHYHIFKNAGTSFEWALQEALGEGFRPLDSASAGGFVSAREIVRCVRREPALRALSSHQATLPAPSLAGRQVLSSILIRDPIARIRSIYAFERQQQAGNPGAVKAKELDFKGYVEWRLRTSPAALTNYQVHFCSRKRTDLFRIDKTDLQVAIANLDRVDIAGTVERYNEWLALAQAAMGAWFPGIALLAARKNISGEGRDTSQVAILDHLVTELGEALARELLNRNELDMVLHQVADALLTRRLAENLVAINLREAYVKAEEGRGLSPRGGRSNIQL